MVVCDGFTETEPVLVTDPTPGSMLTVSALTLFQDRVDGWPALTFVGFAEQPVICTPPVAAPTVTVTDDVSSFTLLRAVKV